MNHEVTYNVDILEGITIIVKGRVEFETIQGIVNFLGLSVGHLTADFGLSSDDVRKWSFQSPIPITARSLDHKRL